MQFWAINLSQENIILKLVFLINSHTLCSHSILSTAAPEELEGPGCGRGPLSD
jgi:hypothetical protein